MSLHRGIDGSDPIRSEPAARQGGTHEERRDARSWRLGTGTLACPRCDAPVWLAAGRTAPTEPAGCPFCGHAAPVRDFLSLTAPVRPARVTVHVVPRAPR